MKISLVAILAFLTTGVNAQNQSQMKDVDSLSAIKIAEKSWKKKFGVMIYDSKPFYARLKNDSVWIVKGTLHGTTGGTPYAEIRRKDGKVLVMIHTK